MWWRGDCVHVRTIYNELAGVGVLRGTEVQMIRKAVLFQDQLEPSGEGGGCHGKAAALAAEQEVPVFRLSAVIGLRLPCALLTVIF